MTATASGRPLRFFALIMIGWISLRLLSQPGNEMRVPQLSETSFAELITVPAIRVPPIRIRRDFSARPPADRPRSTQELVRPRRVEKPWATEAPSPNILLVESPIAMPARDLADDATHNNVDPPPISVPLLVHPATPRQDRWRASAWILWRDSGARAGLSSVGRLGGSQAGVRIDYDLTGSQTSRVAVYARATAALARPNSQEAAIGMSYQPARIIPVSIAVERRTALGRGARDANAVLAVGGFGPAAMGHGIAVEGYAQTGMVGFRRQDFFIDGKLSLLKPVRDTPLNIGMALSGGAQPQVERIDIGPEVQIRLRLPAMAARLNIEWRERIAGRAAPASGLAITLAADF